MLSVIIPAYNAEATIRRCIESVLNNRSHDLPQLEILVINDGSDDRTAECVQGIQDPRVRLIDLRQRTGVGHARNTGIEESRGDFILFIDSDDEVEATYLERLYNMIQEADLDWVACGCELIVNNSDPAKKPSRLLLFDRDTVIKEDVFRQLPGFIFFGRKGHNLASSCCGIYRASLIRQNMLRFDESVRYGEDLFFNLGFSRYCRGFGYIASTMYRYYQSGQEGRESIYRRYSITDLAVLVEAIETWRQRNGIPLIPEEMSFVLDQTESFLRNNTEHLNKGERKKYYQYYHRQYGSRAAVKKLWTAMKKSRSGIVSRYGRGIGGRMRTWYVTDCIYRERLELLYLSRPLFRLPRKVKRIIRAMVPQTKG